ncbi:hypothetical protein [Salipiger sp.]|uniref:hypothetical protein n=1 Tax=Salipiger sp. TaxID=2078585 RepID=UPI003A977FC0
MPATVRIISSRKVVYFRYHGLVTPEECMSVMSRAANAPECKPDDGHLADFSATEDFAGDFHQILRIVTHKSALDMPVVPGTPCAIYAPNDLTFGVARMYQQIAAGMLAFDVAVFRDEAGALAHLGVREPSIAALTALDG